MQKFTYMIQRDFAMHLGPTARLAELAKEYPDTQAHIEMGTRVVDIRKPLQVMTMGIRKGDNVTISVDGPSEVELLDVFYQYFEDYM